MRQHRKDWKKRYGIMMALTAAVLLLGVTGSFAAYTNFSSAKRVVSVRSEDQVYFSSNMLYSEEKDMESGSYRRKRIALTENQDFLVEIYNHDPGDPSVYCDQDIIYRFRASLIAGAGTLENYKVRYDGREYIFSSGNSGDPTLEISGLRLPGGQLSTQSFRFVVPEQNQDQLKICVEAIPDSTSYEATGHKKLAAMILTGELTAQKTWTGQFLDQRSNRKPDAYDGFNYELSGNGQGTVTLTWNPSVLVISPWFVDGLDTGDNGEGWKQISLSVGEDKLAYQLQFYKAKTWNPEITWEELDNSVKISFLGTP